MLQSSARLLALLSLLQLRREWTGSELAARLDVGPRTIRRDIERLRDLGYPVEGARGVAGGYRLGAGAHLPPLLLDDTEVVAIVVGLRMAAAVAVAGMEESAVQALTKLEQLMPGRLRPRVRALAGATSAFAVEGPSVDPELLVTLAAACRDYTELRFGYQTKDGGSARRHVQPCAVVHSGFRWYLVAFDIDRDAWRTFRVDRVRGRITPGQRGHRVTVPGGDPAAYVREQLGAAEPEAARGRVRITAPADRVRPRIPKRWATVEPDGSGACVVTTLGAWTETFLVRLALIDEPMSILGPPDLVEALHRTSARLAATTAASPR